jgi:hypothetical protein
MRLRFGAELAGVAGQASPLIDLAFDSAVHPVIRKLE